MINQKQRNVWVQIGIIFIVVVGVGYYIYTNNIVDMTAKKDSTKEEHVTSTIDIVDGDIGDDKEIISVEDDTRNTIPTPNLNRPVVFHVDLPVEVQEIYRGQIEQLTQTLQTDDGMLGTWLDLGVLRKAIGDYEGAREIWEYVNVVSPLNNVSFFNLGDLYHFYLKDYAAAEQNLLAAKKNNLQYIPVYRALFDLYTLSYKQETSAAEDILLEGLQYNPNHLDLLVLLAGHYKKAGDVSGARTYYEKARDEAEITNDQSMVDLLEEELENL